MSTSVKPKTFATGGRPSKLTPELQDEICRIVSEGNYTETACNLAGISPQTYYNWIKKAEEAYEKGENENPYLEFFYAVKRAEVKQETTLVPKIIGASLKKDDPYAMMMFLERRHPDRWGRKDRTAVTIDEKRTITITHVEVVKPIDYAQGKPVGYGEIVEGEGREITEGDGDTR